VSEYKKKAEENKEMKRERERDSEIAWIHSPLKEREDQRERWTERAGAKERRRERERGRGRER
jgi:hypothetical protein